MERMVPLIWGGFDVCLRDVSFGGCWYAGQLCVT